MADGFQLPFTPEVERVGTSGPERAGSGHEGGW